MGVIDNAVQWATDIANDDSHWYSQDAVSYTHLDVYKRQRIQMRVKL